MARRGDSETALRDSLRAHPQLGQRYGTVFDHLAEVAAARRALAAETAAFSEFLNGVAGSGTLQRAWWAWRLSRGRGADTAAYRASFGRAPSWPAGMERRLLALQLEDITRAFGPGHRITTTLLGGASAEQVADCRCRRWGRFPVALPERKPGCKALVCQCSPLP